MLSLRFLSLAGLIALSCVSLAGTQYRVIDICDFPGGYDASAAWAISSDGRVAGYGTRARVRGTARPRMRAHLVDGDPCTGSTCTSSAARLFAADLQVTSLLGALGEVVPA